MGPGKRFHSSASFFNKRFIRKITQQKFLVEHLNFSIEESIPLIGIISRLVSQKGFDIVGNVLDELMLLDAQWLVLGSGEQKHEEMFKRISLQHPNKVYFYRGYNNELAHLIEAACDIFLMPSKFEPCGLNQIYSLRYGTVPVVRKTGGLADTVHDRNESLAKGLDTGTGYTFDDYSGKALLHSVQRAINDFHIKDVWKKFKSME